MPGPLLFGNIEGTGDAGVPGIIAAVWIIGQLDTCQILIIVAFNFACNRANMRAESKCVTKFVQGDRE